MLCWALHENSLVQQAINETLCASAGLQVAGDVACDAPDDKHSVWRMALRAELREALSDLLPGILVGCLNDQLPGAITKALAIAGVNGVYLAVVCSKSTTNQKRSSVHTTISA